MAGYYLLPLTAAGCVDRKGEGVVGRSGVMCACAVGGEMGSGFLVVDLSTIDAAVPGAGVSLNLAGKKVGCYKIDSCRATRR